jgi:site-specific DNA-methyltransferase (adenine-specific)
MTLSIRLLQGDCLEVLKDLPGDSIDAVVTDPPYGLSQHSPEDVQVCLHAWLNGKPFETTRGGFMGKTWDSWVPGPEIWKEVFRVLKPGGHALVFAGTRTVDLMGIALRLAGFETRDMVAWVYGSGFPKSLDVSKAIDKAAGAEREVVGFRKDAFGDAESSETEDGRNLWGKPSTKQVELRSNDPVTEAARKWEGWGTALKPALEPVLLVRKPLIGTVAENVLKHGTGAINVDGCRVPTDWSDRPDSWKRSGYGKKPTTSMFGSGGTGIDTSKGRWPSNFLLDEGAAVLLDDLTGDRPSTLTGREDPTRSHHPVSSADNYGLIGSRWGGKKTQGRLYADSGGASRFFYCAKASSEDREEGLEGLASSDSEEGSRKNTHTTVKPTELMRYLCRLVTPPNGVVLDPFMGSGSTGKAAVLEGFNFVGVERESEYMKIADSRIRYAQKSRGVREVEFSSDVPKAPPPTPKKVSFEDAFGFGEDD